MLEVLRLWCLICVNVQSKYHVSCCRYAKETEVERDTRDQPEVIDGIVEAPLESGEEGLAIRIAAEVSL